MYLLKKINDEKNKAFESHEIEDEWRQGWGCWRAYVMFLGSW